MQHENTNLKPLFHASYDGMYDPIYDVAYGIAFVFYDEKELEDDTDAIESFPITPYPASTSFSRYRHH